MVTANSSICTEKWDHCAMYERRLVNFYCLLDIINIYSESWQSTLLWKRKSDPFVAILIDTNFVGRRAERAYSGYCCGCRESFLCGNIKGDSQNTRSYRKIMSQHYVLVEDITSLCL